MTLSRHHEDLINLVCGVVSRMEPERTFPFRWTICIEHSIVTPVIPALKHCRIRADAYILADDGYGVICLEVGQMKESKWEGFTSGDTGTKVRVLRVGKDYSCYLRNSQGTKSEVEFMRLLTLELSSAAIDSRVK